MSGVVPCCTTTLHDPRKRPAKGGMEPTPGINLASLASHSVDRCPQIAGSQQQKPDGWLTPPLLVLGKARQIQTQEVGNMVWGFIYVVFFFFFLLFSFLFNVFGFLDFSACRSILFFFPRYHFQGVWSYLKYLLHIAFSVLVQKRFAFWLGSGIRVGEALTLQCYFWNHHGRCMHGVHLIWQR